MARCPFQDCPRHLQLSLWRRVEPESSATRNLSSYHVFQGKAMQLDMLHRSHNETVRLETGRHI